MYFYVVYCAFVPKFIDNYFNEADDLMIEDEVHMLMKTNLLNIEFFGWIRIILDEHIYIYIYINLYLSYNLACLIVMIP